MTDKHIAPLAALVGAGNVIAGEDRTAPYTRDARNRYGGTCRMVVRPGNTDEVAAVVRYCGEHALGIVPQGGNTGNVGGTVAKADEVILNTGRLHRILEVDTLNDTMTVQAGCVLQTIHDEAQRHGRLFPLTLGAKGSCQIGGNIATNAGGNNVLHYGNTRELVLGMEVVMADGTIWHGLGKLRKDNAGYDLRQLMIGSEGTLGIITAAVLKLFPTPRSRVVGLAGLASPSAALELLHELRRGAELAVTTLELMSSTTVDFAVRHVAAREYPFDSRPAWYALLVVHGGDDQDVLRSRVEARLGDALGAGCIADATVAASETRAMDLETLREEIVQVQPQEGGSIKHDVSVPVSRVPALIEQADRFVLGALPSARPYAFGHIGDGNIHYNVSQPAGMDPEHFDQYQERIQAGVHDIVAALGGSISAEHGIGLAKRDALATYQDPVALTAFRRIKHALDPHNLLNPGKLLPPASRS